MSILHILTKYYKTQKKKQFNVDIKQSKIVKGQHYSTPTWAVE